MSYGETCGVGDEVLVRVNVGPGKYEDRGVGYVTRVLPGVNRIVEVRFDDGRTELVGWRNIREPNNDR